MVELNTLRVRPITESEHGRFHTLMQQYHYLGSAHPVGEVMHYVACHQEHWVALLSFSTAALKCAARDEWIGWTYRHQFDRLNLVTNNSRFLILPDWHLPNLGSRVLSLCQRRIQVDWLERFKHPLLLLETFVDPQRFHGTVYRATNWALLGQTKGYRRINATAYRPHNQPKWIFAYPLQRNAKRILSGNLLHPSYQCGEPKLMLTIEQQIALPELFKTMPDHRRAEGRRHRLSTILAISIGAILCGRQGYKGIAQWAKGLGQKARERFDCYYKNGEFHVPSEYIIRDTLIRIDPETLDKALSQWNTFYADQDESLAIDGKTMRNALDTKGKQVHVMSAIGHQSLACYTQKK